MPYFLNNADDQETMLKAIGVESIDDLFTMVPQELRLGRSLNVPPALGELELTSHLGELAARNDPAGSGLCFLGGGSYDHFVPAVVDYVASRSEYVTSYTPYQPEVSQGNLQALFEYQTLIAQLTGMDYSNSSLYDGGSAAAEAVLMAMSVTRRRPSEDGARRVLVARSVHPDYRQILATYLANLEVELVTLDTPGGTLDPQTLRGRQRQYGLLAAATAQLLRLRREDGNAGPDRSRGWGVAGGQCRSDQPWPAQAAG